VTLLFDENLSFHLVRATSRQFPNSRHVRDIGLASADDRAIWEFAKRQRLTIVTFDSDFHERSLLEGWPPKVIWLQTGNTATASTTGHRHDSRRFRCMAGSDPRVARLRRAKGPTGHDGTRAWPHYHRTGRPGLAKFAPGGAGSAA
jgi:predicted nuclease of predicted toxin-antitoxin system